MHIRTFLAGATAILAASAILALSVAHAGTAPPVPAFDEAERAHFKQMIELIADRLMTNATPKKEGITWISIPAKEEPKESVDIYGGSSGVVYFFLKAYAALGNKDYLRVADAGLKNILAQGHTDEHGLYFDPEINGMFEGNAGPGYVFLYAYHVTGHKRYLKTAQAIARRIVAVPDVKEHSSPDIISGAAGTGLFLLSLHKVTQQPLYLDGARRLGDFLLERAEPRGEGITWMIDGDKEKYYFTGFSHGPAGIGYYLDRLYRATNDERYRAGADKAMIHLENIVVKDEEKNAVKWYHEQLGRATRFSSQWCHGSPGMNPFFLELNARSPEPKYMDWAAANTRYLLALGIDSRKSACVCHGIAGTTASVCAMYEATGNEDYARVIRTAPGLLDASMKTELPALWESEGSTADYSYMTGMAGVGDFYALLYSQGKLRMFGPLGYGDDL